jgi:hypothetical protein
VTTLHDGSSEELGRSIGPEDSYSVQIVAANPRRAVGRNRFIVPLGIDEAEWRNKGIASYKDAATCDAERNLLS